MPSQHDKHQPSTPRRRKEPPTGRYRGTRQAPFKWKTLATKVKALLRLDFDVERWQAETILKVLQRYDTMFVAGTGYGKILIFEGLAALQPNKTTIVISPLKALERDQVEQARKKGLAAAMINEDSVSTKELWKSTQDGEYSLLYVSPEMALSASFRRLFQTRAFRERLAAVIVDECHCIDEYGDEFRPQYKRLDTLRAFTGHDVPFVSCTATMSTKTFEVVWNSSVISSRGRGVKMSHSVTPATPQHQNCRCNRLWIRAQDNASLN